MRVVTAGVGVVLVSGICVAPFSAEQLATTSVRTLIDRSKLGPQESRSRRGAWTE
jgi:hypothetical protein